MLLLFWGLKKQGRKLEAGGLAGVRPFSHRHLFQVVALGSGMSRECLSLPPILCVTAQGGLGSWWSDVSSLLNLCFETLLSCICGAGLQSEEISSLQTAWDRGCCCCHTSTHKMDEVRVQNGWTATCGRAQQAKQLHARTWWIRLDATTYPPSKWTFLIPLDYF